MSKSNVVLLGLFLDLFPKDFTSYIGNSNIF